MMLSKKVICLMGTIVVFGVLALTINTCMADTPKLDCQVFVSALSGANNIKIIAKNKSPVPITFNRVVLAYLNPDLTVKGPYVVASYATPVSVAAYTSKTFYITRSITTTQPSGSLVPVIITLWSNYYTKGYDRGAAAGAAKVP